MLWIRIGFNADPDPDFYLDADPDPDPGSQTNADPDLECAESGFQIPAHSDFRVKKSCYMKNVRKVPVGNISKAFLGRYKSLFERQETCFIC